jgi:3-phenylpropionate/cinnamic acid dioxygenase small subunit
VDVERTLQDMVDRQQIVDTLYRYASTIDSKDFGRLRTLFVNDAVGQFGDAEPIAGADEIVGWIDRATRDRAWQHHKLTVYHVDIEGDEAKTLTYHTSHQKTVDDPDTVIVLVARYHDVLRRQDGTWKIASKRMEVGWREVRHAPQASASTVPAK